MQKEDSKGKSKLAIMKYLSIITLSIFLISSLDNKAPQTLARIPHIFLATRRYDALFDSATKKSSVAVDSTHSLFIEIDSSHVYLGDSVYTITKRFAPTDDDLILFTRKTVGLSRMDTGKVWTFLNESAEWRFDIDPIKNKAGEWHIMIQGSRRRIWNNDTVYCTFSLCYFEAIEINFPKGVSGSVSDATACVQRY